MLSDFDSWARANPDRQFRCFDPYQTYARGVADSFILPNGDVGPDLTADTYSLFSIGEEAFTRLAYGEKMREDEFKVCLYSYWIFIDEFRSVLEAMHEQDRVIAQDIKKQRVPFDISMLDETQLISIRWEMHLTQPGARIELENIDVFRELFLFHALREIDNALIGVSLWGRGAIVAAIGAANALSNAIAIESGNEKEQEIRRDMAYKGAVEKLKRDPKQAAKIKVKECWLAWKLKPENYKGKSAFAKDMMAKFEELDSQAVIARWCGQWEKEAIK